MKKWSEYDKMEAQDYLRQRLDLEIKGQNALKKAIKDAFFALCALGIPLEVDLMHFSFENKQIKAKADKVLNALRNYMVLTMLGKIDEAVSLSEKRNEEETSYDSSSLKRDAEKRANKYFDQWKKEAKVWIVTAKANNMSEQTTKTAWQTYRDCPYDNPFFAEAKKREPLLVTLVPMVGVGMYKSAENALVRLLRASIGIVASKSDFSIWQHNNFLAYYVQRGSSYPCELCDSHVGLHVWIDVEGRPPYHPRCCCYYWPIGLIE